MWPESIPRDGACWLVKRDKLGWAVPTAKEVGIESVWFGRFNLWMQCGASASAKRNRKEDSNVRY